jgi:hypothetical protein
MKIFVTILISSVMLFAQTFTESITVVLKYHGKDLVYKCEPKKAKWYELDSDKDDEIDEFCDGEKALIYFMDYSDLSTDNIKILVKNNMHKVATELNVNDFEDWAASMRDIPEHPEFLKEVGSLYSLKYDVYLKTPTNRIYLEKNKRIESNSKNLNIELDLKNKNPKIYTNTYDIDEDSECIYGKVWIKKYGKMSGDQCDWILSESDTKK